ncbi:MAG TPA: DUF4157 domain-containing protein [Kofleriaceae bacterium]|nr:DUF4157 domain-containing protein [Kofleriaceae bacterium]
MPDPSDPRDPRDPREDDAEQGGAGHDGAGGGSDGAGGGSDREHVEVSRRGALSDEIARRWDPRQLLRTVGRGAGSGTPLDATTRGRFERRLGVDLGGVRVYTGEFAEKVTTRHAAEAVTVGGTGMIFMSGTPDRSPATSAGRALLAHELTHVAQSSRGIYRSAPGERPPLATEEHEAEAEAVEAEELHGPGGDQKGLDPEKAEAQILEAVTARVLDLVYDDERVHAVRNGEPRTRP